MKTIQNIASALAKTMDAEVLANILNIFVAVDGDERLTDEEAKSAEILFEYLCALCPCAINKALEINPRSCWRDRLVNSFMREYFAVVEASKERSVSN